MRLLAIVHRYPMHDRASGDLRCFELLKAVARKHHVVVSCIDEPQQTRHVGASEVARYKQHLRDIGAEVAREPTLEVMRRDDFAFIFFEFYHSATRYLPEARLWQARAVKIVDSVDVHFKRLFAKASLTGAREDLLVAQQTKRHEMGVYRSADHVIAVTEEDRGLICAEAPSTSVWVVPNVHAVVPDAASTREPDSLLFVGGFDHEPNVDAAKYLCSEIMPLVWHKVPTAKLYIVGDSPPDDIRALAGPRVIVTGYVAELQPYLQRCRVSLAPLRFGAGLKGKVGQAMAAGLPVVTTSIGAEGFGATAGEHFLVADDATAFGDAVTTLLQNDALYTRIQQNAREFIAARYSPEVVGDKLLAYLDTSLTAPVRSLTLRDRVKRIVPIELRDSIRRLLST